MSSGNQLIGFASLGRAPKPTTPACGTERLLIDDYSEFQFIQPQISGSPSGQCNFIDNTSS